MKKLFYNLLLGAGMLLGAGGLNTSKAQIADAAKATTGYGLYKDKIFWINWDLNKDGSSGDVLTNGTTKIFTSNSGIIYKAVVSNVQGYDQNGVASSTIFPQSASSRDYAGNNFFFAYDTFTGANNIIALNNGGGAGPGQGYKVSFRVTVTATYPNGITKNAGALLIAGTETLGSPKEFYELSVPDGANPARVLELYKNEYWTGWSDFNLDAITSRGGLTVKAQNLAGGDSRGDMIIVAENTPLIDVSVQGGGMQHFAIGVVEELDFGDAPLSYEPLVGGVNNYARHLVVSGFKEGLLTNGTTHYGPFASRVSGQTYTPLANFEPPLLRVGALLDTEGKPNPTSDASGDDKTTDPLNPIDDEDGLTSFTWDGCAGVVNAYNGTGNLAFIHFWIDANKNGIYESTEYLRSDVPVGTNGPINFNFTSIPGLAPGGTYFVRFRISAASELGPNGFAPDGEVEDHLVNIKVPTGPTPVTALCATNNIGITLNDLPAGTWTMEQTGTSTANYSGSTTSFTTPPLSPGSYNFTVTNSNGCKYLVGPIVIREAICSKDDNFGTVNSGSTPLALGSVFGNDTLSSGAPVNPSTVSVTPATNGPLSIDANGNVTLAANTPNGTYTLTYTVCILGANPANCSTSTVTVTVANFCTKTVLAPNTGTDTPHGITTLGRAGTSNITPKANKQDENWPMVRKGAWTAIEAKTKGFVVTRTTPDKIANPLKGMMIYDIVDHCLKINVDGSAAGWKCFNNKACPQ